MSRTDIAIVGGGAAGLFAAVKAAEYGACHVLVLEQSQELLAKVRISGGGRCNVTHGCFDPKELIKHYPRGGIELLGPFTRFQPRDTMAWFEERGVQLKIEKDGRVFPCSDQAQTIIDAILTAAKKSGVEIRKGSGVVHIRKNEGEFALLLRSQELLFAHKVMLATGANRQAYQLAEALGHTIVPPIPSLFTFTIPDFPLAPLSGVSVAKVEVSLPAYGIKESGPLLITHWGFSGPVVLKLSAFGARHLATSHYQTICEIDYLPEFGEEELREKIERARKEEKSKVSSLPLGPLPRNLWKALVQSEHTWSQLSKKEEKRILLQIKKARYAISGKTLYKSEFVTAGGVKRTEVNFQTMESLLCPALFFGGEVMDIDGITGGFNFQAAWTTGWIAGEAMGRGPS